MISFSSAFHEQRLYKHACIESDQTKAIIQFMTTMALATTMFFLLLLASSATSNVKSIKLPESDKNLVEFPLNLEYLEAEFYLFAALGKGLDYIQPNLTGGGPPPIGVQTANLSPLIRDIIAQFGYQEVGHVRFILQTLPLFLKKYVLELQFLNLVKS